ncbi:hypothetical protein MPL3356_340182 [Mesorhizobium plurifarium]|uniref:Uncharacterized protein n=1 Tax=Mesorhizobium plurifarium TaxID=69974 RepID=A0A090DVN8_MESPL|nr:hypothetical protein MPL3356_340182 [Mesorhizobium plurifarium]
MRFVPVRPVGEQAALTHHKVRELRKREGHPIWRSKYAAAMMTLR